MNIVVFIEAIIMIINFTWIRSIDALTWKFVRNVSLKEYSNYSISLYFTQPFGRIITIDDGNGIILSLRCALSRHYKIDSSLSKFKNTELNVCGNENVRQDFTILTSTENIIFIMEGKELTFNINKNETKSQESKKNQFEITIGQIAEEKVFIKPLKNKIDGCLINFAVNGFAENLTVDQSDSIKYCRPLQCTSRLCYDGRCIERYMSDAYCDCRSAMAKGKYCNDDLKTFNKSQKYKVNKPNSNFKTIFRSPIKKNYCLMTIEQKSQFYTNIFVNSNFVIVVQSLLETIQKNIMSFENNITYYIDVNINNKKILVSNGSNRISFKLNTNYPIETIIVGAKDDVSKCEMFSGKIDYDFDPSSISHVYQYITTVNPETKRYTSDKLSLSITIPLIILAILIAIIIIVQLPLIFPQIRYKIINTTQKKFNSCHAFRRVDNKQKQLTDSLDRNTFLLNTESIYEKITENSIYDSILEEEPESVYAVI